MPDVCAAAAEAMTQLDTCAADIGQSKDASSAATKEAAAAREGITGALKSIDAQLGRRLRLAEEPSATFGTTLRTLLESVAYDTGPLRCSECRPNSAQPPEFGPTPGRVWPRWGRSRSTSVDLGPHVPPFGDTLHQHTPRRGPETSEFWPRVRPILGRLPPKMQPRDWLAKLGPTSVKLGPLSTACGPKPSKY